MATHRQSTQQHSPLGLVAHCSGIEVEGTFEERGGNNRCDRFAVISIDDQVGWESKKLFTSSQLRWQMDYRIWFRPSSSIKIEIFRKKMLSAIFTNKRHLLGRFSGKLIELLENDAAHNVTDNVGTQLEGIKLKIKLALVSDSPRDIMGIVNAAISRLDDNIFPLISEHIDASATFTEGGHSAVQAVSDCIPSLGQAFQGIVKIARTVGDAHPILKLSCTVIFSLYEAFKNEMILDESVRALAESLREMVHSANECPDLLVIEGAENVIEAIGCVSLQIASLIDEYTRLPFSVRGVRDTLSDEMRHRVASFQERCNDLMIKFNSRMVQSVHHVAIAERLQKILKRLKAPDPSQNYDDARERHQEETCTWFLTGKEFLEWKKSAGSLLWVYGIPGCGKTILCSSAIEDVSIYCAHNSSFAMAYFFFDSRDAQDGLQRYSGFVRCLINQLSLQCSSMPYGLENILGGVHAKTSPKLLDMAMDILLANFEHTYVIVDALDECTDKSKVLGWLQRITRWGAFQHNIHIMVTSRGEFDIRKYLESLGTVQVCMQGKSVNDDIRSYINRTLRTGFHMKKWSQATKGEIQEKVLTISGGMFRLAALQLEELRSCCNVRELKKQLGQLPHSLYETYDRILSKMKEGHRETALKVLKWLAFSARILRLNELTEVLAVDFETKPYPRFCDDLRYDPETVLIICANLIIISAEGNVQLAHLSVKEYLLNSTSLQNFGFSTNEQLSHSFIAETCLAYLLQFDKLHILKEDTLDNFPLAQYAADHWVSHARSGPRDNDTLRALIYAFFTGIDTPFITWVRLHDLDDPESERYMRRRPTGSRLYYACLAGLDDIVLALLEAGENPDTKGGGEATALQVASRDGHYQTVQYLLEKGATVNMEGICFGPALKLASARGHTEIVQLLLDNGADVNMQGRELDNSSALQAASSWGYATIVRLLLEKGADVNIIGGAYGSALQAAATEGHEGVVQLLLESGAEVSIRGGLYGNALHEASRGGFKEIVRLLLEWGADVNEKSGEYGTALQAASQGGHEEIVQLLLESGADVGTRGGMYDSALQAAASGGKKFTRRLLVGLGAQGRLDPRYGPALQAILRGGHAYTVRLLLEQGAKVNIPLGGLHGSALRAASSGGHAEVVRLLLERGAELNAQNEMYGTALQGAALEGHEEITKLLLEKGAEVDIPEEGRGSALQAAALGGHEPIVRLLLEKGADINKRSKEYGDALQAASMGGHVHIVRVLLKNGADINARGIGRYKSALQAASKRGHQAIVELLLNQGAVDDDDAEGAR